MIQTIIFDIGNVLADFAWEDFIHEKGYYGEKFQRISEATVKSPAWNEFDRGVLSDEEILNSFIENAPDLKEDILNIYGNLEGIVKKRDYAIEWIEEMKARGFRVLVLSNFPRKTHIECANELDFLEHMDGGILSYQDQVIKPHPEIYQLLLDRYELVPQECLFIDDLEKNIEGASAMGIHTIQFITYGQVRQDLEKILAL